MAEDEQEYEFSTIERKWQEYWENEKTFRAEDESAKTKYYALDMFPYPSGAGLHIGTSRRLRRIRYSGAIQEGVRF